VNYFSTADELTRKVNEAVIAWEKSNNLVVDREPANWTLTTIGTRKQKQRTRWSGSCSPGAPSRC
jgi:hypothetical protein